MNALNNLLDKARSKCIRDSDACLAEKLGLKRAAVSKWRHGGKITAENLEALAALAGVDGQAVIEVMMEQANNAQARAVWKPVLDRLSAAAAVVALGVLVTVALPSPANATEGDLLCIMRSVLLLTVAMVVWHAGRGKEHYG